MIELIRTVNSAVSNVIWGVPAIVCIIGVGLYLSIRTGFIQIRKFGHSLKHTVGRIFKKSSAAKGSMTPFQAVCTALAATIGTGNIAGVAGAIALGGPGAVFWMWVSALLGMCTKFCEVTLAVSFREKNKSGDYVGGPMYYIKNGLKKHWHWLAYAFATFGVCAVFGTGNATQVNTIISAINTALTSFNILPESALNISNLIIGIIIAAVVALILLGGIKRIGKVTEKLVPVMALLYIILGIGVIVLNANEIPEAFASIFLGDRLTKILFSSSLSSMIQCTTFSYHWSERMILFDLFINYSLRSVKLKQQFFPCSLSTQMLSPCASMIVLEINSPRPTPVLFSPRLLSLL